MSISYIQFVEALAEKGMPISLSPAQRAFAAFVFDGVPLPLEELVLLFGDASKKLIPAEARKVVAAVCGRGSGKSLLGGTRVLHLAMTVDVSGLMPREIALCPVVAPDLDTAKQVVRFALGAAETLKLKITHRKADGEEEFSIWSQGKRVRIAARAASAGGSSIRGRFMPCAVLDEVAFFRDSNHKINDQDIFDALKPRIAPDGQLILLSSPWAEIGLLYELYRRNFGHAIDAVVAHAPTGLMRAGNPEILRDIELERAVDPEKCSRERDASFMTANEKSYFNPKAVNDLLVPVAPSFVEEAEHYVGGDFAFRRNSSAFASSQATRNEEKKLIVDILDLYEKSPVGGALKPSVICKEGAEFAKAVSCDEIIADGHHRESIVEHLENNGVHHIIAPAGAAGKSQVYQATRQLLHENRIRLHEGHPLADKLVRQLKETTYRNLAGGDVSIDNPLWRTGEHGDLVSAFVLAVWRAYKLSGGDSLPAKAQDPGVYGADEQEIYEMHQARSEDALRQRVKRMTGRDRVRV